MSKNTIIETSKALQDLYHQYTHLPLGGKQIVCPYWMNKLDKKIYGPGGGKARPEEIVALTINEGEKQKIDLSKFSEAEIVEFMKKNRIGVDCSGLAFWLLNALDIEKGGNGIDNDISGARGKEIKARANVQMLTENSITQFIEETGLIKPGDMMRFRGGKHVAVVLSLGRDSHGKLKEIIYCHSSSEAYTKISGVHSSEIIVIDPKLPLRQQKWEEKTCNNASYGQYIWPDKGDGIKRLKIWK